MKNITLSSVFVLAVCGTNLFSQNEIKTNTVEMLNARICTKELSATKKTTYTQRQTRMKPFLDSELSAERKSTTIPVAIGVKTFPNPFTSDLSVSINDVSMGNSGYEAILYDLQGRKVFSRELFSNLSKLNLTGIDAGMYVLHIQKNGVAILQEKVVKQ